MNERQGARERRIIAVWKTKSDAFDDRVRTGFGSVVGAREPEKIKMIVRVRGSRKPHCAYRRSVDDFPVA